MDKRKLVALVSLLAGFGALSVVSTYGAVAGATPSEPTGTYLPEPAVTATLVNGDYQLDFSSSNLSFVLTDTRNGISLHSGRRVDKDGLNSATWKGLLADGLAVGYRNGGHTLLKPYSTLNGSATVTKEGSNLSLQLNLRSISISFEMDLALKADGSVCVSFPSSSFVESAKDAEKEANRYELAYLLPYLGLGDSFELQQKGSFLFVPDGCGAIADLSTATIASAEYDHRVYGTDIGIQGNNGVLREASANPEKKIKLPVYGLSYADVPGVMGVIESGAPYADIYASVSGLSTHYNFGAVRFNYREEYYRYVDRAGHGITDFMEDPYVYDASIRYHFLPAGASLGKMAEIYRQDLTEKNLIKTAYEAAPSYRLEWLVSESKESMFGTQAVAMTHPSDVSGALADLTGAGLAKPKLAFLGYQNGGWSQSDYSRFGYASAFGENDYLALAKEGYQPSFDFDYGLIRSSAKGYGDGDLAMTLSNQADYTYDPLTYASSHSNKERVLLGSKKSQAKLENDERYLSKIPGASLSIKDFGTTLFSSHYQTIASREEAIANYQSILSASSLKTDLAMPNSYLLFQASSILETDYDSSAYTLAPTSVPFYQMCLSGRYDFYSKPLNLNYGKDVALRLIESDTNPSFLLSGEDSVLLYQTPSSYLFSSQYSSWQDKIEDTVKAVEGALAPFRGVMMSGFERLSPTLSCCSYANGKQLWVNHSEEAAKYAGLSIPGEGYLIV